MPNIKIYVDHSLWDNRSNALKDTLLPIRELLCANLNVDISACQLALIPIHGLTDQPAVNLEAMIMPRPERTKDVILSLATKLKEILSDASGAHAAVRIAALDPETYLALK